MTNNDKLDPSIEAYIDKKVNALNHAANHGLAVTEGKTYNTEDEDDKKASIRKAIQTAMFCGQQRPKILNDEMLIDRINEYFSYCADNATRPTVEGLALMLDVSRKTLWEWCDGSRGVKPSNFSVDIVKKAKEQIASFDSSMVTDGKLNPVVYIFRAKNYYGMKDQQDVVVTPNTPQGEENKAEADKTLDALPPADE